jgi:hypothetical protein
MRGRFRAVSSSKKPRALSGSCLAKVGQLTRPINSLATVTLEVWTVALGAGTGPASACRGAFVMDRKTWGPFTGSQLTILLTAAILAFVPTALWSVEAYTRVVIQDHVTGARAAVDPQRRLVVLDQIGAADETPGNFVYVFFNTPNVCTNVYTVPAGKALVLKSLHAYLFKLNGASPDLQVVMWGAASCSGDVKAAAISSQSRESKVADFGNGLVIPAGRTISVSSLNNSGTASIYGYLVPAAWVPASASADAPADAPAAVPQGVNPLSSGARR